MEHMNTPPHIYLCIYILICIYIYLYTYIYIIIHIYILIYTGQKVNYVTHYHMSNTNTDNVKQKCSNACSGMVTKT